MNLNYDGDKPIFLQIAEGIEDAIISGAFPEEQQMPSVADFAVSYKINPATALKGINILVDAGAVYKKRGIGMFVKDGAVDMLKRERKEEFYHNFIEAVVEEAKKLGISKEELVKMLERGFEK